MPRIFIGDVKPMNISGDTSPTNMLVWGAGAQVWQVDLYIRRYMGAPEATHGTDEYKSFIFLLLSVLAASPDGEPPKQANYTTFHM
jgi:hypothetical protein